MTIPHPDAVCWAGGLTSETPGLSWTMVSIPGLATLEQFFSCYLVFSFLHAVLELQPGAAGFQLSNPPVLPMVCLVASLAVSHLITLLLVDQCVRCTLMCQMVVT